MIGTALLQSRWGGIACVCVSARIGRHTWTYVGMWARLLQCWLGSACLFTLLVALLPTCNPQYTEEHRNALAYFRAVLETGEMSARALALTADMIGYNQVRCHGVKLALTLAAAICFYFCACVKKCVAFSGYDRTLGCPVPKTLRPTTLRGSTDGSALRHSTQIWTPRML